VTSAPAAGDVAPAPTSARAPRSSTTKPPPAIQRGGVGSGILSVVCEPNCSEVRIDGNPVGPSPIFSSVLPVGRHTVELVRGTMRKTRYVDVESDRDTRLQVVMSQ
jgi:hypothetical protein